MAKIVIFTSNQLRHKYLAARFVEEFGIDVKKIFFESRTYIPREIGKTPKEEKILEWHFDLRDKMEEKYFREMAGRGFGNTPTSTCTYGDFSKENILNELKEINPDLIIVFGTSIITDDAIEVFPNKIINLHLGISPYYRGSGTNFWALYNDEPEYVGATILYLDKGIDTGEIIHHARPIIESNDNHHSIGCKTIIEGVEKMIQSAHEHLDGDVKSYKQWKKGIRSFCYRKNFTPQVVEEFKGKLENGLFKNYLSREESVHDSFKIIS